MPAEKEGGWGGISYFFTPLYDFHLLHRPLDISRRHFIFNISPYLYTILDINTKEDTLKSADPFS